MNSNHHISHSIRHHQHGVFFVKIQNKGEFLLQIRVLVMIDLHLITFFKITVIKL